MKKCFKIGLLILLFLPLAAGAVNDVSSVGPTVFQLLTTDTIVLKDVVLSNGALVTNLSVQTNYIDITIDSGSHATFTTDGTSYISVVKISGGTNYGLVPICPLTTVALSGTAGAGVILRLTLTSAAPVCSAASGHGLIYPTNYSMNINGGDSCTDSPVVSLLLQAQNASQVLVGNDSDFTGSNWQPFSTPMTLSWTLIAVEGNKAVYVLFRSIDGTSSSIISKMILYNSDGCAPATPPPSPPIPPVQPPTTPPVTPAPPPTQPPTPLAGLKFGDTFKGTAATVYYYGQDGKRYIFPDAKTFLTWYLDFSKVKYIVDSDLAKIPLGSIITYRPGIRMLKLQTMADVYAVDADGTLRWIVSEALARELYGNNWVKKIDDLNDAFFVDYRVGEPIRTIEDFNPLMATQAATDINTDQKIGL
ncbi:MAG: hypothetical protein PHC97_04425 [Patescibacteria group bacterium]|nr:hypothetical protein [Patescibacteria group bacterium]